jgi:hypothetical protein
METETTQMNEQLALLDHRLAGVEREVAGLTKAVAVLTTDVAVLSRTAATKEDIARIDATLVAMQGRQANFATKADLAQLETRIMKWMITTLVGVAALNISMVVIVVKLLQV